MNAALLTALSVALTGAPEITDVQPEPLALGGVAEITGAGFDAAEATVDVAGVSQNVIIRQADRLRFLVAEATPLGSQTLTVTVGEETADRTVEVAGPAPQIDSVTPDPVTLGRLATILGEHLSDVDGVEIEDRNVTVTEQTDSLIVFQVPYDPDLVGEAQITLRSPSGIVRGEVTVIAPLPQIDAIGPNPARIGDLVEVRGRIIPINVKVLIGQIEADVVKVRPDVASVIVPDGLEPGPYDVVVTVNGARSPPEGPLYIQPADPNRPVVRGIYPINPAKGGAVWIVGDHLDDVEQISEGLTIESCDRTSCRLLTTGIEPGVRLDPIVETPAGAAAFTIEIKDEPLVVPTIAGVEPSPAFRGQPLVISGTDFQEIRSVVLGGQAQSITFFTADSVTVDVHTETSLGAERLFVASNGGSEAITVTVLDPFPDQDVVGGSDAGDVVGADTDGGGGGKKDDCAGAPGARWPIAWVAALAWLGLRRRQRA